MTDIQNFCDRNSVTHNKNQNDTSNVFDIQVKNSNVGLEITGCPKIGVQTTLSRMLKCMWKKIWKKCFRQKN
jgi:hypothetical protein